MGANARSTVGTATDAYDLLRVIFSRLGQPNVGPSSAFSFNVPAGTISGEITLEKGSSETEAREITITGGMCAECEGLGRKSTRRHRRAGRQVEVASTRARSRSRASSPAPGTTASTPTRASSTPTSPSATSPMRSGSASSTARRRRSSPERQPHLHGARRQDPPPLPRQGRRLAPAERARGRRADRDHVGLPVVRAARG